MLAHGLLLLVIHLTEARPRSDAHGNADPVINVTENAAVYGGRLWLFVAIFFVAAALLYFMRRTWFWIPAAAGLMYSQILIMTYPVYPVLGTALNLIVLLVVMFCAARMNFQVMVKHEIREVMKQSHHVERVITAEDLAGLPQNVQRWIVQSGAVGKPMPHSLRVEQTGTLRIKPEGRWMPFRAVQHFSLNPPSFIWNVRIRWGSFFEIAGRDKYFQGHGSMLIKPLFLFTAANSAGKEIDQGTLLRFMAEMSWFPQSALSNYIRWESIDDNNARATMEYLGAKASGIFHFNPDGSIRGFEARRYGEFEGIYRKENWSVAVTGYKSINGVTIGYKNEVTWKLKEGDFTWLRMEVTDITPSDAGLSSGKA